MIDALDAIAADSVARVVVLEGNGPAFSAGHDIAEMVDTNRDAFYRELFSACVTLMQRLHEIPQPVIAKVRGVATAAGCQLVAACDLAIASEDARFATPGVNIGLFCSTPMVPVSRSIGRKRALEMLFTGDMIDAATACEWGLVNRVVPGSRARRRDRRARGTDPPLEPGRARARQARVLRPGRQRRSGGVRARRAASWSRTRRSTTRKRACARSSRSARRRGRSARDRRPIASPAGGSPLARGAQTSSVRTTVDRCVRLEHRDVDGDRRDRYLRDRGDRPGRVDRHGRRGRLRADRAARPGGRRARRPDVATRAAR